MADGRSNIRQTGVALSGWCGRGDRHPARVDAGAAGAAVVRKPAWRGETRYAPCGRSAQTVTAGQITQRAARAYPGPGLLASPEIAPPGAEHREIHLGWRAANAADGQSDCHRGICKAASGPAALRLGSAQKRSARRARGELCAGPWAGAAQRSRRAAPAASVVRRNGRCRTFAALHEANKSCQWPTPFSRPAVQPSSRPAIDANPQHARVSD